MPITQKMKINEINWQKIKHFENSAYLNEFLNDLSLKIRRGRLEGKRHEMRGRFAAALRRLLQNGLWVLQFGD